MKLELIILGLLTVNPCTGYDIKKYLDTEGRFGAKTRPLSQIYTTLKHMAEAEYVDFEIQPREGKPDLKVYSITAIGRKKFMDYLHSPLKLVFRYRESDLYLRLMYAYLVEPEVIIRQLKRELAFRLEQISSFRNRNRTISSSLLTVEQVQLLNEVYEKMHEVGAKGIDDYVLFLQDLIAYFEKS